MRPITLVFSLALCLFISCAGVQAGPTIAERSVYPRVPLIVSAQGDLCPVLVQAVNNWNAALGETVLIPQCALDLRAEIVIVRDANQCQDFEVPDEAVAITVPLSDRSLIMVCAPFSLHSAMAVRVWTLVLMHELGHALGLAHTPQRGSLMFPTIELRTDTKISESDAKAVWENLRHE